jgi:hypothetical protein
MEFENPGPAPPPKATVTSAGTSAPTPNSSPSAENQLLRSPTASKYLLPLHSDTLIAMNAANDPAMIVSDTTGPRNRHGAHHDPAGVHVMRFVWVVTSRARPQTS